MSSVAPLLSSLGNAAASSGATGTPGGVDINAMMSQMLKVQQPTKTEVVEK
jgi:hypothetical protein